MKYFGTTKATDINCPRIGRGQGQVDNFRISYPRNISGTAKAAVDKFCVVVGYIKC